MMSSLGFIAQDFAMPCDCDHRSQSGPRPTSLVGELRRGLQARRDRPACRKTAANRIMTACASMSFVVVASARISAARSANGSHRSHDLPPRGHERTNGKTARVLLPRRGLFVFPNVVDAKIKRRIELSHIGCCLITQREPLIGIIRIGPPI